MSEPKKMAVSKFTLSSGKVIYLRDPKVADQETCAKLCGGNSDNVALMGVVMNKEMLKQLLVGVQPKGQKDYTPVNPSTCNLDELFTYAEYQQAGHAVKLVTGEGEDSKNDLKVEVVSL